MSRRAVEHFDAELQRLMNRTVREYEMSVAELVGVLQMTVVDLTMRSLVAQENDSDG